MRRTISLLLTAVMLLSLFTVGLFTTTVSAAAASVGSVEAGYTPKGTPITSEEEFLNMAPDGDYYLANDITINTVYGLSYDKSGKILCDDFGIPLLEDFQFSGTFDGNGKMVTLSVPMFAYLEGATIKNLSTKGAINFRRDGMNIAFHCGAIAMEGEYLTIENVSNNAEIKGYDTGKTVRILSEATGTETVTYSQVFAGGLIGSAYGDLSMKNCVNYMPVTALCASGLVGSLEKEKDSRGELTNQMKTYATFDNCHNYAVVSDNECEDLFAEEGGLMVLKVNGIHAGLLANGTATEITFQSCTNQNDILTENSVKQGSGACSGGISGYLERSDDLGNGMKVNYLDCINEGEVVGAHRVGGIAGYAKGSVTALRCENKGNVTSRFNYAAGIVGRAGLSDYSDSFPCELIFEKCTNSGTITSHSQYSAGITSFSVDRIKINYCINTGDIRAEGVSERGDNSAHNHDVNCAGLIARSQQSIELYYCVNTGSVISNFSAAGIAGRIGTGELNGTAISGYNTFFGCFSGGDVTAFTERNLYQKESSVPDGLYCSEQVDKLCSDDDDKDRGKDGICDSLYCSGKIGVDYHKNYYSSTIGAAGIVSFSRGSGNTQAPRIFGCGVTANITATHVGTACAFMGYAATAYAMVQGNYFLGELNGPDTCLIPYNITLQSDYCLEYATTWINGYDSQKYIKDNYFLESIKDSGAMLLMNNGSEISWSGYDCLITQEDVRSGKLCYLANKAAYEFIHVYPFLQKLGYDLYPMSPYNYLTYTGTLDNVTIDAVGANIVIDYAYWVNEDANGNYVNELHVPVVTDPITPGGSDDPGVTPPEGGDDGTTAPETNPVSTPETNPQTKPGGNGGNGDKDSGGCGSVVGASLALAALAFAAPAVIVLRKKED